MIQTSEIKLRQMAKIKMLILKKIKFSAFKNK